MSTVISLIPHRFAAQAREAADLHSGGLHGILALDELDVEAQRMRAIDEERAPPRTVEPTQDGDPTEGDER
jgi:hypothetical protein